MFSQKSGAIVFPEEILPGSLLHTFGFPAVFVDIFGGARLVIKTIRTWTQQVLTILKHNNVAILVVLLLDLKENYFIMQNKVVIVVI